MAVEGGGGVIFGRELKTDEKKQFSPVEFRSMASPFTSLQAWLAAAGGDAACVTLTDATSTSAERGLVTAVSVDAGATLVRVPLVAACTPSSALRCPVVRALLRGDLSRLKRVLCSQDVPHPSILTLSLALLADAARGPTSPRHPYIALLPAPPGSPFASAAPHGPAATDVTLFSDEELAHLACPPFEQAVRRERDRVTRVWGELFAEKPRPTRQPALLPVGARPGAVARAGLEAGRRRPVHHVHLTGTRAAAVRGLGSAWRPCRRRLRAAPGGRQ